MQLNAYFKSVLEQERASVVICNLQHEIIYMNPAAQRNYHKWGGEGLLGRSLMHCHAPQSRTMIEQVVARFAADRDTNIVYTTHNEKQNKDVYMVALRDDNGALIGYYEKHEYRTRECAAVYDTVG